MTRTSQTEQKYKQRALQLALACGRVHDCQPAEITTTIMAEWLISNKSRWSPSTWRQYCAAVSFTFGSPISELLHQDSMPKSAKRGRRTSGLREKRLPPDDLKKLLGHFLKSCNRSDTDLSPKSMASLLLVCGTITGLRPCEWPSVVIGPHTTISSVTLLVQNAKNTNGRGNGEARDILLPDLNKSLEGLIRLLVNAARRAAEEGSYEKRFASAAKAVYRATRELWPRRKMHYTLYSPRHQASANWKTILTREQIAALMGHRSIETASTHYGRRSAGRSQVIPGLPTVIAQPSAENLAAIYARTETPSAASLPIYDSLEGLDIELTNQIVPSP